MSKTHLRKILSMIEGDKESEESIRSRVSNYMDIGRITEDEAAVIDFAFKKKKKKKKKKK